MNWLFVLMVGVAVFGLWVFSAIKVLAEYERAVVFRLGRLLERPKGPGLAFVFWPIDRMVRVSLRTVVLDVPPQDVITRDNVTVSVNAVVYFRVLEASKAVVEVENFLYATSQLAQTTLRSVLGEYELDDLLASREQLNERLQTILDQHTDPWGIKVSMVEVKTVDLPQTMQRAMSKQAEAEREKRAKMIHAQGELNASQMLVEAASTIAAEPTAIQLRYLQTLAELGVEKNTTIVFPLPMDLIEVFMKPGTTRADRRTSAVAPIAAEAVQLTLQPSEAGYVEPARLAADAEEPIEP
ncbi:MAG: slipin family protein [Acidobacteria bacterium]|nr:slipin family protein [Acidobacteriota bacterium]